MFPKGSGCSEAVRGFLQDRTNLCRLAIAFLIVAIVAEFIVMFAFWGDME